MRLKAKHRRSFYKSDVAYIRAVYVKNKKKIDANISPEWVEAEKIGNGSSYKAFKELVLSVMEYTNPKTEKKYTVEEAIRREAGSKDLNKNWSSADVYARNFHSLVTSDKEIKEIFYQHEGIKKIDYKQYEFLGYYYYNGREVAVYKYGDSYFLEHQSPKDGTGATLTYLSGYQWQRYQDEGKVFVKTWRKRSY